MKKGDVRRSQIIDTAERLFFERGYENTSVQDILDIMNLSKGGFYHHFESKMAVLEEVCERRCRSRFSQAVREICMSDESAVQKLNSLMGLMNIFEREDAKFIALYMKVCYLDRDTTLKERLKQVIISELADAVSDVIINGKDAKELYTRTPEYAGRVVLTMAYSAQDEALEILASNPNDSDSIVEVLNLMSAYRDAIELTLNAPFGSIELFDPERMSTAFKSAINEYMGAIAESAE